jgi:hypothetical protein
MKKIILFTAFIIGFSFSWAQTWSKIDSKKATMPEIEVLKSSEEEIIIGLEINAYNLDKVQTPEGIAFVLNAPETGRIFEAGSPDLPLLSTSLIIDDDGMYSAELEYGDYFEIENINIAPSKGSLLRTVNPDDVPYTYGEAYQKNEFFPAEGVKVSDPFIFRDFRGISLNVFPYTYNPVSKVLRIYTSISVKLTKTDNVNPHNAFIRNKSLSSVNGAFNEIYESVFLNYKNNPIKYTPLEEGSPGNILIISHPDYMETMTNYISWKTEKGYDVEMIDVTDIGSTANLIGDYIETYFNDNGLTYLLFVGDSQHIPPLVVSGSDSDNAYSYVLGDDGYADFFVGRFSGESVADIETQVARTIFYERDMDETNTWLENALLSASNEGGGNTGHDGGESDEVHMSYINNDLEAYGYTVINVNQDGGNNAMLSNAVNEGIGIANYVGHGSDQSWVNTNFTNTNVNALTNQNKLLFSFSVACVNGNFVGQTCFAEAWLRATDDDQPTGAIGFLASTINQSWNEPMTGQDEMVDILVEAYNDNIKRTFAGVSLNGMFLMIEEGGQGQSMADTWTVFGDPSLLLRTKTPQAMNISHLEVFSVGETQFNVNCDIEGALVAVSKLVDDNVELIGTSYVEGGVANLELIPFEAPGTMKVTVTAFNKITYQEDVMVIVPEGPYVVLDSFEIDDEDGNNNQLADYGESVNINVTAKNVGVETANSISCTISSSDQLVEITQDNNFFGDIEADNSINVNNAFSFDVAEFVPDQHTVVFNAEFQDGNFDVWNSTFSIKLNAPSLVLNFIGIDDSESGNNDGMLDSGETVDLIVEILNQGHANAVSGQVEMDIEQNAVEISNSNSLDGLDVSEAQQLVFTIEVDEMLEPGSMVLASFNANLGAYNTELDISLPVGMQVEDWETSSLESFAWLNDESLPWTIDNENFYEGENSLKSGTPPSAGNSSLIIILDVVTDDEVSFMKKVSCEEIYFGMYFDFLGFYINDQLQDQWAGEIDWTEENYEVPAGNQELRWTYTKDAYFTQGEDCAWIDYIVLPPHTVSTSIMHQTLDIEEFETSVYPNPATDIVNLIINAPKSVELKAEIYTITGTKAKTVFENRKIEKGSNIISFNVSDLQDAYYILVLSTEFEQIIHKISINN